MNRPKSFHSLADLGSLLPPRENDKEKRPAAGALSHHDGKGKTVRLYLDTKGRKGKTVTIIAGLQHNPDTISEIARTIKRVCGCGGTTRGMEIELQGDQRDKAARILGEMNYVVR